MTKEGIELAWAMGVRDFKYRGDAVVLHVLYSQHVAIVWHNGVLTVVKIKDLEPIHDSPTQPAKQDAEECVKLYPVNIPETATVSDQLNKIKEELDEVFAAFHKVDKSNLCEELVDIQVACETALKMLGCDTNKVRDYVNSKNKKRGYLK